MRESNLNQALYSIKNLPKTKELDIGEQLELIILSSKAIKELEETLDYYNNSIKEYYSNQDLTKKEINEIISIEDKINLNFIWNMEYNFSCKLIKLSNQETEFVKFADSPSFFSKINNLARRYNGIRIIDFRCRKNREDYVNIINSINMLSQLKFNNITLK